MTERTRKHGIDYMRHALNLAGHSPPKPTNFRVGAFLVRLSDDHTVAEGYTLELPGNTHAEECCLLKLAEEHSTTEEGLDQVMEGEAYLLYTTMEPCAKRLSGKLPCVERILRQKSWIKTVFVGVSEPETFVGENQGTKILKDAGIDVVHIPGLEDEILAVATAGHTT